MCETGPVRVNRFLHVPKIVHNLVSGAGLCHIGHTVKFTKNSCVIEIKRKAVRVRRLMYGIYAVYFKTVGKQQALAAREKKSGH